MPCVWANDGGDSARSGLLVLLLLLLLLLQILLMAPQQAALLLVHLHAYQMMQCLSFACVLKGLLCLQLGLRR